MKKITLLTLLILCSYGNEIDILKTKIIENIAHIFIKKRVIKVYDTDPYFYDIFKTNKNLVRVYSYEKADLILTGDSSFFKTLKNKKNIPCIISTKYKDYKNHTDIDVGAFFWQKGRPNIILNTKILQKEDIVIPKEYDKFLE